MAADDKAFTGAVPQVYETLLVPLIFEPYAADLVRRKVDILLAFGASEALAAVKATATIPIVFMSPVPVELGLVRSLARPGGNATGVSADMTQEVVGKLLELLKMRVPRLSRIAVLGDPAGPALRVY